MICGIVKNIFLQYIRNKLRILFSYKLTIFVSSELSPNCMDLLWDQMSP